MRYYFRFTRRTGQDGSQGDSLEEREIQQHPASVREARHPAENTQPGRHEETLQPQEEVGTGQSGGSLGYLATVVRVVLVFSVVYTCRTSRTKQ